MQFTKTFLPFSLGTILAAVICPQASAAKIGISMPNDLLQLRWFSKDSVLLKQEIEKLGHEVVVTYAGDNDVELQSQQVNSLVDTCDILIISPLDSQELRLPLEKAYQKKLPVIAYDRMIKNSKAVSYYVGTDSKEVGALMAKYVIDKLKLIDRKSAANIEIMAGDINDENTSQIDYGMNQVLKPYFDLGKINILSRERSLKQNQTVNWSKQFARERMQRLCEEVGYGPKSIRLDAVIAFNDSTARGAIDALRKRGYVEENYPVITGQDCDNLSVMYIENGIQSMSLLKDERKLASETARIVDAISKKKTVTVNHPEGVNNGIKNVPAQFIDIVVVTKGNVKEALYDTGYIQKDE